MTRTSADARCSPGRASRLSLVLAFFTRLWKLHPRFLPNLDPGSSDFGGLILLAIGLEMVRVIRVSEKLSQPEEIEGLEKDDISIIPLAIPMLSGPAAIATVVVLGSKASRLLDFSVIIISIAGTLTFTFLILRYAGRIFSLVGRTGLNVVTRVMGLLLCAMAIQFLIDGYHAVR